MRTPRRLVVPIVLSMAVIAEAGCSNPNAPTCPPPGVDAESRGTSLNNLPVVFWNGVNVELLPDGSCEAPPTV